MIDLRRPEHALELRDQFEIAVDILVRRDRRQEIARVRQTVRADRAEIGQAQRGAEVLGDVAARLAIEQLDAETDAARNHRDLLRLDIEYAELGRDAQPALLRHDQQLAVGVVEEAALHRAVGGVDMDAAAGLRRRAAVAGHREQAIDEIRRRASAAGSGSQRNWFGDVGVSSKRLWKCGMRARLERPCNAAGRMR